MVTDISDKSRTASKFAPSANVARANDAGRNLSDVARDRFMQALFAHRIELGAFLSQAELVKILGVPVGPLRDALRTLQAEGWLTIHARSGIELRKPDLALVRNSYQLRLILERAAVRAYAELVPLAQLGAQEQRHRALIARIEGKELTRDMAQAYESVDFGLHLEVIAILSNPLLEAAYKQALGFVQLIRFDRMSRLSTPQVIRTMHEHLEILTACKKRDPQKAMAALEVHNALAMQRAIGFF
jgi:DNA-binding GntR family transcriptional regulator